MMNLTKYSIVLGCAMVAAGCGDRQAPSSPKPPAPQAKPEAAPAPGPVAPGGAGTADKDQKKP